MPDISLRNSYTEVARLMHVWNDYNMRGCYRPLEDVGISLHHELFDTTFDLFRNVGILVDNQIHEDIAMFDWWENIK